MASRGPAGVSASGRACCSRWRRAAGEAGGGLLTAAGFLGAVGPALIILVMLVALFTVHWGTRVLRGVERDRAAADVPDSGTARWPSWDQARSSLDALLGLERPSPGEGVGGDRGRRGGVRVPRRCGGWRRTSSGRMPDGPRVRDRVTRTPITTPPETVSWMPRDDGQGADPPSPRDRASGELVGMITDRDVRLSLPSLATSAVGVGDELPAVQAQRGRDHDQDPDHGRARGDAREAARLMVEHKMGALPVVEDGRLVGILDRDRPAASLRLQWGRRCDVPEPDDRADEAEEVERLRQALEEEARRHLRLRADFDNLRRRAAREQEVARREGRRRRCCRSCPCSTRSSARSPPDPPIPISTRAWPPRIGCSSTALREAGAEPVESVGRPFDPERPRGGRDSCRPRASSPGPWCARCGAAGGSGTSCCVRPRSWSPRRRRRRPTPWR